MKDSVKAPPADASDIDERIVCFCHCVTSRQLVAAIRAGATTLADIQERTRASTGCTGCESDVLEILEEELRRKP